MTGFSDYTFKFHDTLSKGLTFKSVMKVTVGGEEIKPTEDDNSGKTYTAAWDADTQTVTITLNDFYKNYNNNAGAEIIVKYTAVLNENAEVGFDSTTNKAQVEFSNDPSTSTSTDISKEDEVDVYTFGFTIDKFYVDRTTKEQEPLGGAEFALYGDNAGTQGEKLKLVKMADGLTWRLATAADGVQDDTIVTDDTLIPEGRRPPGGGRGRG